METPTTDASPDSAYRPPPPSDPLSRLQQSIETLRDYAENGQGNDLTVMTTQNVVFRAEQAAQGFDGDPVRRTVPELCARAWERTMWHCFEKLLVQNGCPRGLCLHDARFALDRVRERGSLDENVLEGLRQWIDEERRLYEELLDREGKSLAAVWSRERKHAPSSNGRFTG